jgi:hypothetical protein
MISGESGSLRKIVIEIPRTFLGEAEGSGDLESCKILRNFKSDSKGFAGICRLRLRGSKNSNLKSLIGSFGFTKVRSIVRFNDGSHIAYIEGKPMNRWVKVNTPREGFQSPPFELTPKALRKTLIGSEVQIKRILKKFESNGLPFKIVWAGEAKFSPDSLTSSLTEAQMRTLSTAYTKGYYDFPRGIDSAELARTLNLSKSTVSEHLRRAEKSILNQVFAE